MTNKIDDLPVEPNLPEGLPISLSGSLDDYLKSLGDGSREFEGLETGISKIDQMIGGLNKFVLLAGMSGVGKSVLAVQLALGVMAKEKIPVVYYSFEMDKRDVITMALQNISRKLYRNTLILQGNKTDLEDKYKQDINKTVSEIKKLAGLFYIKDASSGKTPDIEAITQEIGIIKQLNHAKNVLVVIDSIQDIIPIEANQTQAEAQTAQRLVELQQKTKATILAIAQKNKAGVGSGGGYGSVMGSVGFIHKPTTVLELISGQEAISRLKQEDSSKTGEVEEKIKASKNNPDLAKPVWLNIIKGRNSGEGLLELGFYGQYRYYEVATGDTTGVTLADMQSVGLI